ncbi:MAG: DNA gyrase inhibitor YacG [Alphaproteobacteria bacterium]
MDPMPACPICAKPAAATAPFCSARCRDRDLNRWFTGAYAVPAVELDDVDAEALQEAAPPPEDA